MVPARSQPGENIFPMIPEGAFAGFHSKYGAERVTPETKLPGFPDCPYRACVGKNGLREIAGKRLCGLFRELARFAHSKNSYSCNESIM